jgi:hypothetical protein
MKRILLFARNRRDECLSYFDDTLVLLFGDVFFFHVIYRPMSQSLAQLQQEIVETTSALKAHIGEIRNKKKRKGLT